MINIKILNIATISNTINAFLVPHIQMLYKRGAIVDVAANIKKPFDKKLIELGCEVYDLPFSRNPLKNNYYELVNTVKKIVINGEYNIVHTHTPIASAVVRLACRNLDNVRVIYTAHGFHFFKGAPLINWLFYYPIEKILSNYTDLIITINKEDYEMADKKLHSKRVEYIHGIGFNYNKFSQCRDLRKREQLGISKDSFVISSVGELNKNKNHKVIIEAISRLNNPEIHYLIAGDGQTKKELYHLIDSLGLEKNIHLLGYRNDIHEILGCSDAFAFPSFREGLGISAIEAMASGLPILTSNIHGINDYSVNGITGFSYNPKDVEGFASGIENLLNLNQIERKKISTINKEIANKYDVNVVLDEMNYIYDSFGNGKLDESLRK